MATESLASTTPRPQSAGMAMPSSLSEDAFLGGKLNILQPEKGYRAGIDAVFLATRYRKRGRLRPTVKVDHFPAQQCSTYINGAQVTSQHDECIRFPVNGYHLCQYLQQFNGWVKDLGRRRFPHLWLVSQTPLPSDAGLRP